MPGNRYVPRATQKTLPPAYPGGRRFFGIFMDRTQRATPRVNRERTNDSTIEFSTLHARDIARELHSVPDTARLRARQQGSNVQLLVRPHGDGVVRRVFSKHDIEDERRELRRCLSQTIQNLTPARRAAFSPASKKAERTIDRLARSSIRHDIRAAEVRSPIRLLAYGHDGKRSVESRPTVQAKSPATPRRHVTMQNLQFDAERERRLQLGAFRESLRKDKAVRHALFGPDAASHAETCLCLFSGIVSLYQQRVYEGGASDKILSDLYAKHCGNGKLMELFISHWRAAWDAGKLPQHAFPWGASVDWLVSEFEKRAPPPVASPRTSTPRTSPPKPVRQPARQPPRVERRPLPASASMHMEKGSMPEASVAQRGHTRALRKHHSVEVRAPRPSPAPQLKARATFTPGRQATTVSIVDNASETALATRPQRSHTVAHGRDTAQGSVAKKGQGTPSSARGMVEMVRAVGAPSSPLSPLSPVSPSSPVFAGLIAMRRGQSAGPGYPMGRMRATTEVSSSELPTKMQRSLSSPYRGRSVQHAATLPATPQKPLA